VEAFVCDEDFITFGGKRAMNNYDKSQSKRYLIVHDYIPDMEYEIDLANILELKYDWTQLEEPSIMSYMTFNGDNEKIADSQIEVPMKELLIQRQIDDIYDDRDPNLVKPQRDYLKILHIKRHQLSFFKLHENYDMYIELYENETFEVFGVDTAKVNAFRETYMQQERMTV